MPGVLSELKSELGASKIDPLVRAYLAFADELKRADLHNMLYKRIVNVDDERDWDDVQKRVTAYARGMLYVFGSTERPKNRKAVASIIATDMRNSRDLFELVVKNNPQKGQDNFRELLTRLHMIDSKTGKDISMFQDTKYGAREHPQAGDERIMFQTGPFSATASLTTAVDFFGKMEHSRLYDGYVREYTQDSFPLKYGIGLALGLVDEDGIELYSMPIQRARELNQHRVQIKTSHGLEEFVNTGILIASSDGNNPENLFLRLLKEIEQLKQIVAQGDETKIQARLAGYPGLYQRIKDRLQGDIEFSCRGENTGLIPATLDNLADPHGLVCHIYKQFEDIDANPRNLSHDDRGSVLDLAVELCRKMPTYHTELVSQYPIIRLGECCDKTGKPAGYSVYYLPLTENDLRKFATDIYVRNIRPVLGVS